MSDCKQVSGSPIRCQPCLYTGPGAITFGTAAQLGFFSSPYFFNTYCHIEARTEAARNIIGDRVLLNNNACLIAENSRIIGDDCLIGPNVQIFDSDFHNVDPGRRTDGSHAVAPVTIGTNVFIGAGVKILRGVTIGENSVIASGSLVTQEIPPNVIAGGIPARSLTQLKS